jgi:hypothetical protein
MKYVVNDQLVLSRPPEGPLAGHIVSFAKSTTEQGYGLVSLGESSSDCYRFQPMA